MATGTLVESVKKRAYELYQKRGGKPGNDQDDWFKAEKEVLSQANNLNPSSQKNKSNGKKRQPFEARTY